ncbi:hypothetical protein NVS47_11940 [Dehalobacterium formicoaceticum]|uniref:DUF5673 domain-containing protein n=1 Tax=Dehalobacterium formicoaceticum TaxID=51515 RepID=A0ABT1Y5R2_9FIRM|nr:hypothetical protein [Dehalobacterium formicoaceticum]MCR6546213.1 hypothetical protein [Dehalobacterium formicoaceticum]
MMPGEILKHIATILISILTAAATTFLMNYMKDKKRKMVEQIISDDDRIGIIKSIVINSFFSFILALSLTDANLDNNYKSPFIILIVMGVVFFTYAHLRFHKSFLIDTFRNKQTKLKLILITIFILIIWLLAFIIILNIKFLGDKPTNIVFLLILLFYTTLFNLSQYFKWDVTRSYNKIVVVTIDGNRYESIELINIDDSIVIFESKNDKRVIIPNHQIKLIEYEYKKTTIANFIDEEH